MFCIVLHSLGFDLNCLLDILRSQNAARWSKPAQGYDFFSAFNSYNPHKPKISVRNNKCIEMKQYLWKKQNQKNPNKSRFGTEMKAAYIPREKFPWTVFSTKAFTVFSLREKATCHLSGSQLDVPVSWWKQLTTSASSRGERREQASCQAHWARLGQQAVTAMADSSICFQNYSVTPWPIKRILHNPRRNHHCP